VFRTQRVSVPVISVGNITAGGSGKTPIVEHLLDYALTAGRLPAVVTRGYRRESRGLVVVSDGRGTIAAVSQSGDEAAQMARKYPSAIVVADANRVRGSRYAVEQFAAEVIVLDDAFQHRSIGRDLNIVVFDAEEGLQGQNMLPAGRLREPLESLRRADVVLLSRCHDASAYALLADGLRVYTSAPVLPTRFTAEEFREVGLQESLSSETLRGERVLAFCGIGAPASFRLTWQRLGMELVEMQTFKDHHWYELSELQALAEKAREEGISTLVTTEKDAVRLQDVPWERGSLRLVYPVLGLQFLEGEDVFRGLLERCLQQPL
jgi:tetraacyldisaccharide 4'-kinase